jgi:hypothetical protein
MADDELDDYKRCDEALSVIRRVRRIVDGSTDDHAEEAIKEAADHRIVADELRTAGKLNELHRFCREMIDRRELLAKSFLETWATDVPRLERIRRVLAFAGVALTPRTRNLGKGARGAHTKGGD